MKRGAGKISSDIKRSDMYKAYKRQVKDDGDSHIFNLSSKEYSKVVNLFNKKVSSKILEDAFEFILPYRLGILRIKKYKSKLKLDPVTGELMKHRLRPNWKATKDLWDANPEAKENKKIVYHLNEHTEGYNFKWHFSNYRSNCPNKSSYSFIPTRDNKRRLAAILKDELRTIDYYE